MLFRSLAAPALERGEAVRIELPVFNTNRTVGTMLGSRVTRTYGADDVTRWRVLVVFTLLAGAVQSAEVNVNDLLRQAHTAWKLDNRKLALSLADQAVEAEPKNPQAHLFRGNLFSEWKEHERAITNYTRALELDAKLGGAFQQRGTEYFRFGKISEAIADFDRYLALNPKQEPQHWQRGIAYYYAGRFAEGRRQFELHQTVNPNDVENAVWHFLCVARLDGVEKARKALIPIRGDARVPMMQVHALFAGKLKPEDVLAAEIGRAHV